MAEQLQTIEISKVIVGGNNPRTMKTKSPEFCELVDSIAAQGVIVPAHVRSHPKEKGRFRLLAGERRLKASIKAGRETIPAINHGDLDDAAAFEITFIENFARADLSPIEQGKAVVILMQKYKGDSRAVASKMGKSVKWIRQRQALGTKLSKKWTQAVTEDETFCNWTAGHLGQIAALPAGMQDEIFEDYGYDPDPPSISQLEGDIAAQLQLLNLAGWVKEGDTSCGKCNKRTSCQPGLFDDTTDADKLKKNDRCMDHQCWQLKTIAWLEHRLAATKAEHPTAIPIATEYLGSMHTQLTKSVGDILSHYDYEASAKKAKGAMPGLVVHGKGLGTVLWIRLKRHVQQTGKKIAGRPTPLKERRVMLTAKRGAKFLVKLAEVVETKTVADLAVNNKTTMVMALAAKFGVQRSVQYNSWGDVDVKLWHDFTKILMAGSVDARSKLFGEVLPNLINNLRYNGPITQTPPNRITAARRLAALFAIDVKAMQKEIAAEMPEPKSWAGLNEDGTPKKKVSAKKAKAKKAKAKPAKRAKKSPSTKAKKAKAVPKQ